MSQNKKLDINITSELLDALTAQIAIIDREGAIIQTNKAWRSFTDATAEIKRPEVGDIFFESLQKAIEYGNDDALKILIGVKKVIQGRKSTYTRSYSLETKNNSYWFKLTARPCNEGHRFLIIYEDITSSVEAKRQLKENKNRYQIQFEQSMDGILITDTQGKIIDANPAASKVLGRTRSELIACDQEDIVDVKDPDYQKALAERDESGSCKLETNFIHKDGHQIPVEISSRAYRTPNGKLRAILSFRDISEQKKIRKDLINNRKFTESALDSIPGVFLVLDSKGNIVRWNEHMVSTLGYSEEELFGKNALEFIKESEREKVQKKMEECFKEGELSVETEVYSKKGGIKEYFLYAKRFVQDGEAYLVGAGIDITASKKNERENRKSQLKLQQLFDNAPVGIAIADTDNRILEVNKSFETIFGFTANEMEQKDINHIIVPEDKKSEAKAISKATKKGEILETKTVRRTKDGKEVPVLIGSVPVELNNEIIAIYGIYVDITQQQEYQEKIEKTLNEKEILLAELHHRVKNNLALINSLLELQLFESEDPELIKQLTHIKNRILTIASIHEVLYRQGNFHDIPFYNFMEEFIQSGGFQDESAKKGITFNNDTKDITLDIDQSIPCGLLLNEIIALIFEFTDPDKENEINIRLREYEQQVHLVVEGYDMLKCPKEVREHQSLHNILIEPLVNQLQGVLLWPTSDGSNQKFELIFSKESGNRPSRKLLEEKH